VATPGGDVAIKASLGWSKSVALQEWFGPSTLAYLQPAFNGYRLRPNGRRQWLELLNADSRGLRAIFRNIGKTDKPPAARLDVVKYQRWIDEYEHVWEKTAFWDGVDDGTGRKPFLTLCANNREVLKQPPEPGKTGKFKRLFRKLPDDTLAALEELKREFTTFLWRSQLVGDFLDELKNPWRSRRTYLQQASGTLHFELRWDDAAAGAYQLLKPPKLERSDGTRYRHPEDIYLNPLLLKAADLRAFYEQGFDVKLTVVQSKKRSVWDRADKETLFTLRLRQPNGGETLEQAFRDMVSRIVGSDDPPVERLRALVRLHPVLEARTRDWIEKQAHKPADAKEQERREKEEKKQAKKAGTKPAATPEADSSESFEDTTQRKEIDEAMLLFGQWLNDPRGARQSDAIESVLEQIQGPFIGYREV
jgi:hypothetical protein